MSSSKLITKESLSAYERWELPNVADAGARKRGSVEEEAAEVKPLTAEQLEQIQAEAHKEGFESGHREGYQAGMQEVQAEAQRLHQVVRALAEPLQDVDERVENELVELALAVARQIIRRQLKTDPGEVVGVVREALGALPSAAQQIRLFLHPEDAVLVKEALAVKEGDEPSWRLVEDPALTRGGCRVETDASRIDATVENRLAATVAELMGGERKDDGPDA